MHRHHREASVDHRHVDELALARTRALQQRGNDTEGGTKSAAGKISQEIERRLRKILSGTQRPENATHREIIDVVSGFLRARPALPISGQRAINQTGIELRQLLVACPNARGHAGTKALDKHIHGLDEPCQRVAPIRRFQIERDELFATGQFGNGKTGAPPPTTITSAPSPPTAWWRRGRARAATYPPPEFRRAGQVVSRGH